MICYNRIIILIMDGVGCGVQGDYKKFHKERGNTLKNVYKFNPCLHLPYLEKLGLSRILFNRAGKSYMAGKMKGETLGCDTFAGVWEMLGVISKKRFKISKSGFPKKIIKKIERNLGVPIVGNKFISGFQALDKFYEEHEKRRGIIMYLANDGVVLLAAHEKIIPAKKLNMYAKKLSTLLDKEKVVRIITRPFIGNPGAFVRTVKNREDIIIPNESFSESALPILKKGHVNIFVTEHIYNILGRPGFIKYHKGNINNFEQLNLVIKTINGNASRELMIFCLEDFDLIGHEKDINKYSHKLNEFDRSLPRILKALKNNDLLIITADHGCDPTINMRGHTREYVPLLIYSKRIKDRTKWLGTRKTFSDLGQSILYNFSLRKINKGETIYEIF